MTPVRYKRYMNTPKGKATRGRANKKWAKKSRAWFNAYRKKKYRAQLNLAAVIKLGKGCLDCGYNEHAVALDFDHRDPSEKKYPVAKSYGKVSDTSLLSEIAKCDVRCANCHRVRTKHHRVRTKQ